MNVFFVYTGAIRRLTREVVWSSIMEEENNREEYSMLGAIIGDIVGSRFERHNIKSKKFDFFAPDCRPTDDSVMTLAIAKAFLSCDSGYSDLADQAVICMRELGRCYSNAGYGGRFIQWLNLEYPKPYGSFGNGSAMRVSPCAYAAATLDDALRLAEITAAVTHNHPEGIRGAKVVAGAVFLALHSADKKQIKKFIEENYYRLDFTLNKIRPVYTFDVSCQGSVPQAIEAFLESTCFEDAIRSAISIGGDSDTIAAITGSIAEAYYGIPAALRTQALSYLDEVQIDILNRFEKKYGIANRSLL